jgi:uncharacterized protein YebE (UPF0316 family)
VAGGAPPPPPRPTLRIVLIGRGMAVAAAACGFVESLVWLVVVSQILRHLTVPLYYVAYAAGFATGNYVGLLIERRLAMGCVILQVISQDPADEIMTALRQGGLGATLTRGEGFEGPVDIVRSVLPRRQLRPTLARIKEVRPKAFYTVAPVAQVDQGVFPPGRTRRPLVSIRQKK